MDCYVVRGKSIFHDECYLIQYGLHCLQLNSPKSLFYSAYQAIILDQIEYKIKRNHYISSLSNLARFRHADCMLYRRHLRYDVWLQWCLNEGEGVSNDRRLDCLINRLFRRRSMKTSSIRITGLCQGNSPVTGEIPAQRASNAEMFSFDDVIMRNRYIYMVTSGASLLTDIN